MKQLITIATMLALAITLSSPAFAAYRGRGNVRVKKDHKDDPKNVTGQVTAVNSGKNTITVNGQVFDVPRSAKVTINGEPGQLMQVKAGDQASVGYTIQTIITIRSGGRSSGRSSKSTNTGGKDESIEADSVAVTRQ